MLSIVFFRRLSALAGIAVLAVTSLQSCDVDGGARELIAAHSGLCVQVEDGSEANGARIVQDVCDGSDHQRFTTVDVDDGFQLVAEHSGMCLAIQANGARQQTCGDSIYQVLDWTDVQQLRFVGYNECLDVPGATAGRGVALGSYQCTDQPNEQFELISLDSGRTGQWSDVVELDLVPVAMANLPSGNVLMWSAWDEFDFGSPGGSYTETSIFDPNTTVATDRRVSSTGHDFFCPGIANLPDGRVLINGGSGASETSIYDPATDTWEDAADMIEARGYNSSVTLADGSVLTMGGSWSGSQRAKKAEVYQDGEWTSLPGLVAGGSFLTNDSEGIFRSDNHMWLFTWTEDRVFQAGPSQTMHWLDTTGEGSAEAVGRRGSDGHAMNGNAVMYDSGKILTIGGGPNYASGAATRNAHVIDLNQPGDPEAREIEPMTYPRAFHSSVVLPNGEVIVFGGQHKPRPFSDSLSIMVPELFNPFTETWRPLAPMAVPRNYHSAALLLNDGRVLVGGGGLCADRCNTNHPDVEIFTPPYLLNNDGSLKDRPTITDAPASATYGATVTVEASADASQFVLLRDSNSTHAVNNGQRRLTVTSTANGDGTSSITMPTEPGKAPPGSYSLFALTDDGTPSVSVPITLG